MGQNVGKPVLAFALAALVLAGALGVYVFEPSARHAGSGAAFSALDGDERTALKVLFIGNSFTFYGPLPEVFGKLVQAGLPERGVKVRMVAFPDAKLAQHEERGDAAKAIERDGPWDYVVLQDQSRMAWSDPIGMRIAVERLDARVRAAGARTVLYMTWADARETAADQEVIATAYERMGSESGLIVAPVGRAWFDAGRLRPKLYGPDGHHPSALGTYMAACVLYAVLAGKSPEGLPNTMAARERASAEDVSAVQAIAARAAGR